MPEQPPAGRVQPTAAGPGPSARWVPAPSATVSAGRRLVFDPRTAPVRPRRP